jgi:uncharacterized protein (TIGR04255 family)
VGQKMRNAPVYFAIGQVQHNPLLSLDSYLPGIQESMRKTGYPDFKRGLQVAFNLTANVTQDGTQVQAPPVQKLEQYSFLNAAGTSGFVLLTNALSFQTTQYDTFESFSRELRRGLEILQAAVGGMSFIERLGLRYLDAVVPAKGESMRDYLANEVLGLSARMTDYQFSYSFTESVLTAQGTGQVVSRTIIQNAPLGFPPDLQPQPLRVADRFRSVCGEHAVIDTDGSLTARKPFELNEVQQSLQGLHDLIDKTFHATATEHARSVWSNKEER